MDKYKVVKDEIIKYLQMDINNDNMISHEEMYAGLLKSNNKISAPIAMELFKSLDVNKDGKVSKDELERVLTDNYITTLVKESTASLEGILKDFDANKDGQLSYDECLNLFKENFENYQEWLDFVYSGIGKTKKDKLTKEDIVFIHTIMQIEIDNDES